MPCPGAYAPGGTRTTSPLITSQEYEPLHHSTLTSTVVLVGSNFAENFFLLIYTGCPPKNGTVDTVDFSGLCYDQHLFFFTLLDRASFPHYNNTKIIKFGWELFILWVISYGLSFSGYARFPEFRDMINDSFSSTCANTCTCTIIQPATKKSPCQWRAWIVNPCHWTL